MEIWKDVEGYEGLYQVSNKGNFKKLACIITYDDGRKPFTRNELILSPSSDKLGYKVIGLTKNRKCALYKVHRLIALAFIPNPENKPHINHINGVKYDNRIENLEWCTVSENMHHTYKVLDRKAWHTKPGVSFKPNEKKVIQKDKQGVELKIFPSITIAAKSLNGKMKSLSNTLAGKRKSYKGFIWEYA